MFPLAFHMAMNIRKGSLMDGLNLNIFQNLFGSLGTHLFFVWTDTTSNQNLLYPYIPLIIKGETRFDLWKWPSTNDKHMISEEFILPIRPCLDISLRYSTKRSVVKLLNSYFVQKFI